MNMTCNNCKYCEKCDESDRNYICTSFRKAEVTGKMLKVKNIQSKMYIPENEMRVVRRKIGLKNNVIPM